jgi:hypothetical protein
VIAASTTAHDAELLRPSKEHHAEAPKAVNLGELEVALKAGRLSPDDAKSVCGHLSLGRQLPLDLLARVAAACSN